LTLARRPSRVKTKEARNKALVLRAFAGNGRPRSWIAADVVRIADGVLAEHWDVLQDEVTRVESRSGLPMFGDRFAD
jgi:predicted SnoaL-like aldol condensation-catalyzing enzyme